MNLNDTPLELLLQREPTLHQCAPSPPRTWEPHGSKYASVRTEEHGAWRQQMLLVNQGNDCLFFLSTSSFFNTSFPLLKTIMDCNHIPVVVETSSHVG